MLIYLNDSSGSDLKAALRTSDGATFLVDCIQGLRSHAQNILQEVLQECVKPCIFLDNLCFCMGVRVDEDDNLSFCTGMDEEQIYRQCKCILGNVNAILGDGDVQVHPEKGTVAFGSSSQGWAFTIESLPRFTARRWVSIKKSLLSDYGAIHFTIVRRKCRPTPSILRGAGEVFASIFWAH